jgi:hypothetical protein
MELRSKRTLEFKLNALAMPEQHIRSEIAEETIEYAFGGCNLNNYRISKILENMKGMAIEMNAEMLRCQCALNSIGGLPTNITLYLLYWIVLGALFVQQICKKSHSCIHKHLNL